MVARIVRLDGDALLLRDLDDLGRDHDAQRLGILAAAPRAIRQVEHGSDLIFADVAGKFLPDGQQHIRTDLIADARAVKQRLETQHALGQVRGIVLLLAVLHIERGIRIERNGVSDLDAADAHQRIDNILPAVGLRHDLLALHAVER